MRVPDLSLAYRCCVGQIHKANSCEYLEWSLCWKSKTPLLKPEATQASYRVLSQGNVDVA